VRPPFGHDDMKKPKLKQSTLSKLANKYGLNGNEGIIWTAQKIARIRGDEVPGSKPAVLTVECCTSTTSNRVEIFRSSRCLSIIFKFSATCAITVRAIGIILTGAVMTKASFRKPASEQNYGSLNEGAGLPYGFT